jgi:hypothetical protein
MQRGTTACYRDDPGCAVVEQRVWVHHQHDTPSAMTSNDRRLDASDPCRTCLTTLYSNDERDRGVRHPVRRVRKRGREALPLLSQTDGTGSDDLALLADPFVALQSPLLRRSRSFLLSTFPRPSVWSALDWSCTQQEEHIILQDDRATSSPQLCSRLN